MGYIGYIFYSYRQDSPLKSWILYTFHVKH